VDRGEMNEYGISVMKECGEKGREGDDILKLRLILGKNIDWVGSK
jgi:hypothetical protein